MNPTRTRNFVDKVWDRSIVPALKQYIAIPNKSAMFDPQWREHKFMAKAAALIADWCDDQPIAGKTVELLQIKNEKGQPRTPVIYMEIPGDSDETVLLYGHLDKQPEFLPWAAGLHPWKPVMRKDRLYGRGGADDGYAAFASLSAIRAVREGGGKHARCVVLIEACEESGSFDLPAYIEHLAPRIGKPSLVICLDSGCGNYEQLWCTTSLRGMVGGNLNVRILDEGVHSGDASGIVPSTFRIARQLLSRLEDEKTGRILPREFHVAIPRKRLAQAKAVAVALKDAVWNKFPFAKKAGPIAKDLTELILNRTWRPQLAITGADGLPSLESAGNVLRPTTSLKVSLRLPPTADGPRCAKALKKLLERDPPYGAQVEFSGEKGSTGWNAPAVAPWLENAMQGASKTYFGKKAVYMGEGGSIPFMGMLGAKFPKAQFMITGVLGPHSNAHGPNEFLHVPTGKKLTACVAQVLDEHRARSA